ncbi:MAG: hypothetical protein M1838_004381, partial [Thelocarpon superellum]
MQLPHLLVVLGLLHASQADPPDIQPWMVAKKHDSWPSRDAVSCNADQVATLNGFKAYALKKVDLALKVDGGSGNNSTVKATGQSLWDSYFGGLNATYVRSKYVTMLSYDPLGPMCYANSSHCLSTETQTDRFYVNGAFCPAFFTNYTLASYQDTCVLPSEHVEWGPWSGDLYVLTLLAERVTFFDWGIPSSDTFETYQGQKREADNLLDAFGLWGYAQELYGRKSLNCTG